MELNGCGGKGSWVKPPYRVFFEASCNKHDKGYTEGGDDKRRFICDLKFLNAMLNDCYNRINNPLKRTYYSAWAFIYFIAVRRYGGKYFNYK